MCPILLIFFLFCLHNHEPCKIFGIAESAPFIKKYQLEIFTQL